MASSPLAGVGYLLGGLRLIAQSGLRRYAILPLVVNLLLFIVAIPVALWVLVEVLRTLENIVPSWLGWLDWLLRPLFGVVALLFVFNSFALAATLIASPFNALLADRIERRLTGCDEDGQSTASALANWPACALHELRKLGHALLLAIPFLVLLVIPVVGPLLWLLYSAWILAAQYTDYPMKNHGLRAPVMRQRLREKPTLTFGFGAAVVGLSLVPVINFTLMPAAVAGATLMWIRELKGSTHEQTATRSRVATRCVMLFIDHLSGRISGTLLCGPCAGQDLAQIHTDELVVLLETCYTSDPDSAEALEVYLEQERGRQPRETPSSGRGTDAGSRVSEPLHLEEARAILGLAPDADAQAVRCAHRRLIQRLHPDRGGSDYLAAKVNEAKQRLLE
ncbi:sulfate transporter CysZ [Thiocapsa imhoffii]|uniref:Sulfate transporter CysZ n=1 Tax=Thiocapsa imhoffii TaxID=382777 RepID=A0A9X0WJ47_9GAMM|nr:sulfate transporter CysZ [Thiocapsa imhoffii]MBK1645676.1 sulfate transporter CysZ [Thiocapsa imhoffii]